MRVVEDSATRSKSRHVHKLATWVEASTVLVQIMVDIASHRTVELLSYQFRIKAAADPSLKWDIIEPSLWQLIYF